MASMNGGHFLTVRVSPPTVGLNAFCGSALNQSGSPCTAGTGRGMTFSSPRGQRNVKVISVVAASIWAFIGEFPRRLAQRLDELTALSPVPSAPRQTKG